MKIKIKPLSVNECWQGRRFKTSKYKEYEQTTLLLLRMSKIDFDISILEKPKLKLKILVGVSSKNADLDNIEKPLIDILQKKFGFNDKKIYRIEIEKTDVKKGDEFIDFCFEEY